MIKQKTSYYYDWFILFIVISFTCNLIIPVIFNGASTYKFGPLAALIYNSVIIYCILKPSFNIKVFINKSSHFYHIA